ncbi:dTDP-glucose 4,6-dehydratase [Alkalihalobacterium bogoriense]|uniref:dTDP-glucose 4,6-dehydratase n=1 Tax=Alkalihalobacterium bogoriense TaxID=246272 RepID=UPI0005566C21|nr:dTDP-glucose 4,6-dehydratase [Alkalihalobacterium bogoriense]
MTKQLLVTGGAGFIGSNFIDYVLSHTQTYEVTNVDALTYAGHIDNTATFAHDKRYRFFSVDITKKDQIEKVFDRTYDVIVHFAAESHVDRSIVQPSLFLNTNIMGTNHLLLALLEGYAKKLVYISTDEVYGSLQAEEPPFTEQSPLAANNPYSASKAGADLLVRSYFKTYNAPVITTRCSNNYGPYQHPEKFIPKIINFALKNKTIPVYGDGSHIRDWLYVKDHCQAIYTIMEKGKIGEVYNIGGLNEKTNIDLVQSILSYMGKDNHQIQFVEDRKGHDRRYAIDSTKVKKELGWEPQMSFTEGIKQTVDWYVKNEQWVKSVLGRNERL